jgi:hypothetical protein
MYPALLAQHPAEAGTVVDYRFRTRAGARRNAERTGYGGMRFAWESALDGDEVTPTWAETGRLEQHVTADVALAQWQHYLATGDQAWLRARGWPVLEGAADFWASRAERGDDGRYHINQVEGPDEQNWPVDDSVYTNATAKLTLELAGRAAGCWGCRPRPAGARSPAAWSSWGRRRWTGCRRCGRSSAPTPASRSSRPTWCCSPTRGSSRSRPRWTGRTSTTTRRATTPTGRP